MLLSEARATGGIVIGFGIVIVLGVFSQRLSYISTIVSVVIFLSFGIARTIGIAVDGYPGKKLIQGIIFEFVFGLLGLFALIKYRKKIREVTFNNFKSTESLFTIGLKISFMYDLWYYLTMVKQNPRN